MIKVPAGLAAGGIADGLHRDRKNGCLRLGLVKKRGPAERLHIGWIGTKSVRRSQGALPRFESQSPVARLAARVVRQFGSDAYRSRLPILALIRKSGAAAATDSAPPFAFASANGNPLRSLVEMAKLALRGIGAIRLSAASNALPYCRIGDAG